MSDLIASRTDANQLAIVKALRAIGCSVVSLHRVGAGVPDLLVGKDGRNLLMEIKVPGGKLNPKQKQWHLSWAGQRAVVRTEEEAIAVVLSKETTT